MNGSLRERAKIDVSDINNPENFAKWWDRNHARLSGYISKNFRLPPEIDVDDILQDIYINIQTGAKYRGDENGFDNWLHRVINNKVISCLRSNKNKPRADNNFFFGGENISREDVYPVVDPSPNPLEILLANENEERVRQQIGSLSELDKQIILLELERRKSGEGQKDVANSLGIKPPAYRVRLNRALKRLYKILKHRTHNE